MNKTIDDTNIINLNYKNLSEEQFYAMQDAIDRYNNNRAKHASNENLSIAENHAYFKCIDHRDKSGNLEMFVQIDHDNKSIDFSKHPNRQNNDTSQLPAFNMDGESINPSQLQTSNNNVNYRLIGRLIRKSTEKIDGTKKQPIDITAGKLGKTDDNNLVDAIVPGASMSEDDGKTLANYAKHVNFGMCSCCGQNRARDYLYIIERKDGNNTSYLQLGKDCAETVCADTDIVNLINKLDNISNDVDMDKQYQGPKTKIYYNPKLFMACALTVHELDLTSLTSREPFKSSKEKTQEEISNNINTIDTGLDTLANYHTYKRTQPEHKAETIMTQDGKKLTKNITNVSDSPLCAITKSIYNVIYTQQKRYNSDVINHLVEKTDFKKICESEEISAQVEAVMAARPDSFRSNLDSGRNVIDKHNSTQLDEAGNTLYPANACETLIGLLNDYRKANGKNSLYLPEIKYKNADKSTPYYECNGNTIRLIDLTAHNVPIDHANLASLLTKGHADIPAATYDSDIPVPAYRLNIYNHGQKPVTAKSAKSAECTFTFSNNSSTGYYKDTNTGLYTFLNNGKTAFTFDEKTIHEIFGKNPDAKVLQNSCKVSSLSEKNKQNNKKALFILNNLNEHWQRYHKDSTLPILYDKEYKFTSEDFKNYDATVCLKDINSKNYVFAEECVKGHKKGRLLKKKDVEPYMANSKEYIRDCAARVAAMYDCVVTNCHLKLYNQDLNMNSEPLHNLAKKLISANDEKDKFTKTYHMVDLDKRKQQFYVDIPGVTSGDKIKVAVDKSISADGYITLPNNGSKSYKKDKLLHYPVGTDLFAKYKEDGKSKLQSRIISAEALYDANKHSDNNEFNIP